MKAVAFALLLLLCVPARATEPSCAVPPCPSKRELKEATKSYKAGLKLAQQGHAEQAFRKFERAARLDGRNAEYVTAAELARQQLAADHIDRGNALLAQKLDAGAGAEFARALKLDPADPFAAQRLRDAVAAEKGPRLSPELQIVEDSQPVQVRAAAAVHDFDFRGDTRLLYQQIAQAYGVTAQFDDGLTARQVRMTVQGVDFPTAMSIAAKLTKTFWVPLTPTQFLVANDTAELRRQLEPVGLHTFYVKNAATPQELSEVLGLLRGIFDIRYASLSPSQDTITVRAPQATMVAVERFLRYLPGARPQVALDVKVYEVDGTVLRNLGVGLPLQYTLFNIPSEARNLLNTPGTQDLINQLISSGAINQGNVTGIEALIGQLLSGQQSIFNQPFATFGGGLTLSGLAVQPATVVASLNQTSFRSLTHMTLRSGDGQPATLRLGSRFPILNASFSPISNSAALSQVIGNLSFQAAFPSFTYEDIGLTFKTTPQIHGDSDVTLDTEMSVKQLTGQSFNGVPVLSNREYKGMIRIPDGTTAVVVGTISQSDQRSLSGPPLLSLIPGLRSLVSTTNVNKTQDEILITITPHIVRGPDPRDPGEIVLPSSGQ